MDFHHSFNKQKWKLCITYILINHHRILCICSCILSALIHFFLNANIKQKIKNIKNEKYCIHSCILVLTSLLTRFILRPAWCAYSLNLTFSKKIHLSPSWRPHRKIRANKIISLDFFSWRKIWNKITQKNQSFFYRKKKLTYNDYKKHIHIEYFCKYTLIWKFLNFVHM